MKIGVLVTDNRFLEFTGIERLKEAAEAQGHELVPLMEPLFRFDREKILYNGNTMTKVDVIICRPTFIEEPSLHEHVVSFLEKAGHKIINTFPGIGWSKNKLDQHRIMAGAEIPQPKFTITKSSREALFAAQDIGLPVIIKVAFGTHGKGVFYADSQEVFQPIAEYLAIRDGNPIIIEEFVKEAKRSDLRVFVIGNEVVAAMERTAPDGDVRANTSTGGTGSKVELTDEEHDLALKVAKTFKLEIAGVDLIRSDRGPLVLEINSNPGFKELERVTGIDIAGAIIKFATK